MTDTETLIPTRVITVHSLSESFPEDYFWDIHRGNADRVASILDQPPEVWIRKQAKRIWDCAGWLIFTQNVGVDAKTLRVKLEKASFCHVRFCPVCQWRRALRWKAKMYQILPALNANFPKARWLFLTLTARNVPVSELRDQLEAMNKAWGRLLKRRTFRHVIGWVRSVEVTRSETDGTAHPHFHCLLLMKSTYFKGGEYLTATKWSDVWGEVMRLDYAPVVDIRTVKDKKKKGMTGAVTETLKYAVKESDMVEDPRWFIEVVRQTHKTRAVASGGLLKNLFREGEDEYRLAKVRGDIGSEAPDHGQLRFNWGRASRRYQRRTTSLILQKSSQ